MGSSNEKIGIDSFSNAYSWRTGGCQLKKPLQIWGLLILFLFLFPVLVNLLPDSSASTSTIRIKDPATIVYASNVTERTIPEKLIPENGVGKALLYFTHNHEAFKPVTLAKGGKVAVSHQSENIMKVGEKLKTQLDVNGVQTDILPIDNMAELNNRRMSYNQAYKSIRPHVEKRIQEVAYDLVVDIHRDSVGSDKTTLVHDGESFAKVAFVIGLDHANATLNREKAEQMKIEMEKIVPGITRNIISKGGAGVDGKYNQDLHPALILIEVGGIGNSEEELNRTVAVIAKAASMIIMNSSRLEN